MPVPSWGHGPCIRQVCDLAARTVRRQADAVGISGLRHLHTVGGGGVDGTPARGCGDREGACGGVDSTPACGVSMWGGEYTVHLHVVGGCGWVWGGRGEGYTAHLHALHTQPSTLVHRSPPPPPTHTAQHPCTQIALPPLYTHSPAPLYTDHPTPSYTHSSAPFHTDRPPPSRTHAHTPPPTCTCSRSTSSPPLLAPPCSTPPGPAGPRTWGKPWGGLGHVHRGNGAAQSAKQDKRVGGGGGG